MYDVIVIGARCAGASTAMLLARKGYRVLLLDRSRFPSDIAHGHFIHQDGPARLRRWGLLERITASNCPAVDSVVSDMGDFPLPCTDVSLEGLAFGYGPRRRVLDAILVDAAVDAGAQLRTGCSVEDFLWDGDRMVGIRARTANNTVFTEHARMTVGADGRGSRLAKIVSAPMYEEVPTLMCYVFSYWSGVKHRGLHACRRPNRGVFAHPTNDGLYAVFAGAPISEAPLMQADMEAHFTATVATIPALAELLREGRREERFYGAADLPNFYRKPFGPGWALVGDAGCHKDPYMALGVADALRDAELLSDALDAALAGRESFETALPRYETRRNAASSRAYQDNINSARLQPLPPELLQIRAALRNNPQATRHFYQAYFGLVPRESFFSPDNLQVVRQFQF